MTEVVIRFKGDTTHLTRSVKNIERALKGVETSGTKVDRSLRNVSTRLDKIKTSGDGAANALKAMVSALAGASLFSFVDGLQQMQNQLRIGTKSTQEFNYAMGEIRRIADSTGTSMVATGELFSAVARNADKLGYSVRETAQVTDAMAQALYASGTGAQQAASVMTQFSQILAKGTVNGDEFTTIMENLGGPVLDKIAQNMGLTTAELVELKEKGLIDAKSFTDALIRSLGDLRDMTGKAMPTLSQSLARVQNAFGSLLLNLEASTGIFAKIGAGLEFMADNIRIVAAVATGFMAAFAINKILAIAGAIIKLAMDIRKAGVAIAVASALATGGISALTGLAGAAAVAAGAYLLFDDLDLEDTVAVPMGDAAENTSDAADQANRLNENLNPIPEQLAGITKKYDEILADLNDQVRLSKLTNEERNVESKLLQINDQLSGKMLDTQREILREKLQEIQANERNQTLLRENAQLYVNAYDAGRSSFAKALQAQNEFNDRLRLGLTGSEYQQEMERLFLTREDLQEEASRRLNQRIQDEVNAEAGKYNRLLALETEYNQNLNNIQEILDKDILGRITLSESQRKALIKARLDLEKEYAVEALEVARQMEDNRLDLTRRRIQEELMLERSGLAKKLSLADRATLQQIGQNERQQEIVRDRIEFEKKSEREKGQFALQQGAEIFNQLGTYNKRAFEAAKAFNIANAIMNTYAGATKALATYPPPFNFIAAAAVVASGLAQVASIRSQQYSGRQLGGPVLGNSSYIVGENGPELFTPTTNGSITRNGDLNSGQPVNINFNIQANDATGFDDLLIQRRGLITQMVSDAMNERGQRSML